MGTLILFSALVIFAYMTIWWQIALYKKRNDVADVAWGIGFVTVAVCLYAKYGVNGARTYLVLGMVAAWGLRLAIHIALRHNSKAEDGRYQAMAAGWKHKTLQSYTNVFLSQGFFLLLVAMPILLFFGYYSQTIQWYNYVGLGVWVMGFLFEAIGDYQLAQFIKLPKNKGKIMRYGLWRYTRHPNYFGEISLWWGFYLFTAITPFWYVGLFGPITITFLILGVSGIPMLERRYKGNNAYKDYQKTTSAFFPMLPKPMRHK